MPHFDNFFSFMFCLYTNKHYTYNMENQKECLPFDYQRARTIYTRELKFYIDFVKNVRESAVETPFPFFLRLKPLNNEQRKAMNGVNQLVRDSLVHNKLITRSCF